MGGFIALAALAIGLPMIAIRIIETKLSPAMAICMTILFCTACIIGFAKYLESKYL